MEKYQTLGSRLAAAILDGIVLAPISLLGSYLAFLCESSQFLTILFSSLIGFTSVFYFILMHAFYGQTLGKMAAKVKVVDVTESAINFNQAVLRSLPQLIPVMYATSFANTDAAQDASIAIVGVIISVVVVVFGILNIIVCLTTEKHRALHDYIARTVVVNLKT